mmetsp:Transcript_32364/g.96386  ORF Transcript_32364/g.96386 Transcript_32364/m.96386 type:complete len:428 (-) Transcript_32364:305-1588(-)
MEAAAECSPSALSATKCCTAPRETQTSADAASRPWQAAAMAASAARRSGADGLPSSLTTPVSGGGALSTAPLLLPPPSPLPSSAPPLSLTTPSPSPEAALDPRGERKSLRTSSCAARAARAWSAASTRHSSGWSASFAASVWLAASASSLLAGRSHSASATMAGCTTSMAASRPSWLQATRPSASAALARSGGRVSASHTRDANIFRPAVPSDKRGSRAGVGSSATIAEQAACRTASQSADSNRAATGPRASGGSAARSWRSGRAAAGPSECAICGDRARFSMARATLDSNCADVCVGSLRHWTNSGTASRRCKAMRPSSKFATAATKDAAFAIRSVKSGGASSESGSCRMVITLATILCSSNLERKIASGSAVASARCAFALAVMASAPSSPPGAAARRIRPSRSAVRSCMRASAELRHAASAVAA